MSTNKRVPHQGQILKFWPRPGEMGFVAGTPSVPAIVVDVHDDDNVKLAVVAGDSLVLRLNAPRRTPEDMFGSWEFTDEQHHSELKHLQDQINAIVFRLAQLEQLQADIRDLQAQLAEPARQHAKGRK